MTLGKEFCHITKQLLRSLAVNIRTSQPSDMMFIEAPSR